MSATVVAIAPYVRTQCFLGDAPPNPFRDLLNLLGAIRAGALAPIPDAELPDVIRANPKRGGQCPAAVGIRVEGF